MSLPTSAQVLAATRHVATFAAGAIAMFGLSTKINAEQVSAIINSAGTVVSNIVVLIGLAAPLVSGYFAAKSASPASQIQAVASNPDVVAVVTMPTSAGRSLAASVPNDAVVPAGSPAAAALVSK